MALNRRDLLKAAAALAAVPSTGKAILMRGASMGDSSPASLWPKLAWGDVGHTGVLTDYSGANPITADDTVLEDFRFTTKLTIEASNVTIRNCHFDGAANYMLDHNAFTFTAAGLTVEDCTFEGSTSASALFGRGPVVMRRCRFRDAAADFMKSFSAGDLTIESCFFSHLSGSPADSAAHADGLQQRKVNGTQTTIRGCTFDLPSPASGNAPAVIPGGYVAARGNTETKASICLFFEADSGVDQDVLIENNYLNGGNNSVQKDNDITGTCIVRNNWFGLDYNFGAIAGSDWIRSGNRWEVSGTPGSANAGVGWEGPFVAGELLPGESA